MLWPGDTDRCGAGFAIASIPGALLGALLGQALDRRLQLQSWAQLRERLGGRPALRNDELLFVLLGRLAKSNGRVVDGHIQQARQEMRALDMTESAQRRAITAFNRGKSVPTECAITCACSRPSPMPQRVYCTPVGAWPGRTARWITPSAT